MTLDLDIRARAGTFTLEVQDQIPARGITALVGRSASGKSSLLRVIAGLDPCEGTIRFRGQTWNRGSKMLLAPHKRRVGVVFQDIRLFEHLDVAGNIAFAQRFRPKTQGIHTGPQDDQILAEMIETLDLGHLLARDVQTLSGGERQRVALARALVARPDIVLLDEPLSGLDPLQKDRILPRIHRALSRAGCPAIFVSHDQNEVTRLADRQLTISRGRITQRFAGTPAIALPTGGDGTDDKTAIPAQGGMQEESGGESIAQGKIRIAGDAGCDAAGDLGRATGCDTGCFVKFGAGRVFRPGGRDNAAAQKFRLIPGHFCLVKHDPGAGNAALVARVEVVSDGTAGDGLRIRFEADCGGAEVVLPESHAVFCRDFAGQKAWIVATQLAWLWD